MYTLNFEYDNEKLSDYGMIICSFDGGGGIETVSSGSDITFHQIKSVGSNHFNLYSSTYETAYSSTFTICKDPCVFDKNNMGLSVAEVSAVQRWLCRKNQYCKFKILQKGYEDIYWNVTFSSKQIELNGEIIGLELTLYADAPFAYMDEIVITEDCSENLSFDVYDISDEEGFIYPDVKIVFLESGDFILKNTLDNKTMSIKNCRENEEINLKGKSHIISSSNHDNLPNDFNYYFPRIINSYNKNKNTYSCNLKCEITFCYSPIRKIGL